MMGAMDGPGAAEETAGAPDPASSAGRTPRAALALGCLLVFAVAVSLYLPNLRNGFVFDDHNAIENNPRVWSLRSWEEWFTTPWWGEARNNGLYRPVTLATYAANFELHRLSPGPYHLWNDLLHGLDSVLVVLVVWLSLRSLSAALMAGGLFALHPIHSEAVDWISARADLLSTFFTLAALCLAFAGIMSRKGRGWGRGWLGAALLAACCLLAILSKENGVVAFAALGLAVLLFRERKRSVPERRQRASEEAKALWHGPARPLLVMLVAAGSLWVLLRQNAIGPHVQPIPEADNPLAHGPVMDRICTALYLVPRWLGKLVLPSSFSADYSAPKTPVVHLHGTWIEAGQVWLGALLLAGLVVLLWRYRNRAPSVAFWIGFLLLAYLPTSNLLFPVGMMFSERWLYMPSVAACALAGFAFDRARPAWLGWTAAALLGVVYLGMTVRRTPDWRSDLTLFQHEMQRPRPSVRSQRNYATLIAKKDPATAEQLYRDIVSRFPEDSGTRFAFGTFLLDTKRPAAAVEQLEQANRLEPGDASTLLNLGAAYAGTRQWDRAIDAWQQVLRIDPDNLTAKGNLEAARNRPGAPGRGR